MAKIIDISNKLNAERPKIYFSATESYEVNDDKNAVLQIDKLLNSKEHIGGDTDAVLELMLGKEAVKQIEKNHKGTTTRISQIQVLMIAILAAVQDEEYEVVEARFLKGRAAD